jgi:hypothetical protein
MKIDDTGRLVCSRPCTMHYVVALAGHYENRLIPFDGCSYVARQWLHLWNRLVQ